MSLNTHTHWKRILAACTGLTVLLWTTRLSASSWNPGLLVNTEAFQIIDDANTTADLSLKFGDTINKSLTYQRTLARFRLDDDLSVVGTLSGSTVKADLSLQSSGSLIVEGNLTFGDTLADTITVNAAAWTFANDTDFALSGGVNGLSFDTSTLSVDALNNRVGVGTTAPRRSLEVVGIMSGSSLTMSNGISASGNIITERSMSGATFEGSGLSNCTGTSNKLTWLSASKKFACEADQTGGGGAPDTGIFIDTGPAAFADNDTTQLFDDATKPNIVTDSTSATVLVSVHMHGIASNTANDAFLAARVIFTTNGVDPNCTGGIQLGEPMIGGFTTATTHPWQVSGTFLHNPGVAGTIKYTVCTSAVATGTATDTAEDVRVSIVELGA